MSAPVYRAVKMANGGTDTPEVVFDTELLVGVFLPAAITGTLSLEAKNPVSGSWGTIKTITFVANGYFNLVADDMRGFGAVRVHASTGQAAERQFVFAARAE